MWRHQNRGFRRTGPAKHQTFSRMEVALRTNNIQFPACPAAVKSFLQRKPFAPKGSASINVLFPTTIDARLCVDFLRPLFQNVDKFDYEWGGAPRTHAIKYCYRRAAVLTSKTQRGLWAGSTPAVASRSKSSPHGFLRAV